MRQVKSCGVLVFRREPEPAFLLMRHPDRFDLPKGHVIEGESEVECAYRELVEETGFAEADVRLQDGFRFTNTYRFPSKRFGKTVEKTVVIFLGWLERDREVVLSEHEGHEWFRWQPPHRSIEPKTVDALLAAVERFFTEAGITLA
jgi:8-oxo-dGTP pyrophosphatase MutT (NUDIX family)